MTSFLFASALVLSAANVVLFYKLSTLLFELGKVLANLDKDVEVRVYELLSRASFNWETGYADRSVYIRFDNGLVKKAEEVNHD